MKKLVCAGLLLLAAVACAQDDTASPYRPPGIARVGEPATGEDLYLRDCAWCHGNDGSGTERAPELTTGTNGPAMNDFMLSTGRMPIDHPNAKSIRRAPAYSPEEIDAIVLFMRRFDAPGPEIPQVDLEGDVTKGLTLYQENCAACHSTTAIGGALTPGRDEDAGGDVARRTSLVAPALHAATPTEIAEAIRVGPGTMPVYGEDTLSDEDVSAITRYVSYLQEPNDRGGAPIGHVGPVAEGAVGWIVGVGLLLLFIRWIGTTRGEL